MMKASHRSVVLAVLGVLGILVGALGMVFSIKTGIRPLFVVFFLPIMWGIYLLKYKRL